MSPVLFQSLHDALPEACPHSESEEVTMKKQNEAPSVAEEAQLLAFQLSKSTQE